MYLLHFYTHVHHVHVFLNNTDRMNHISSMYISLANWRMSMLLSRNWTADRPQPALVDSEISEISKRPTKDLHPSGDFFVNSLMFTPGILENLENRFSRASKT